MKKRLAPAALILALCFLFSGCSLFGHSFDAAVLVRGNLDVIYLNTCSDDYRELLAVPPTQDDIEDAYLNGLSVEADYFMDYFQVMEEFLDEDTYLQIISLYNEIYAHSKYEVGEVTQEGDTYFVEVTVWPMDIMQKVAEEDYDGLVSQWNDDLHGDVFASESEAEQVWADRVIRTVAGHTDSIGYLDPVTVTVRVSENADGYYMLNEEDFALVDSYIIQY